MSDAYFYKGFVVESYTADERSVRESCVDDVAGCDLYIGIIGRRYGFIPPGESRSITELEYQQARKRELPTLVFVKDDEEIKSKFHDAVTTSRSGCAPIPPTSPLLQAKRSGTRSRRSAPAVRRPVRGSVCTA